MKEEQMYVVVPLTTYTEERWEKCKISRISIQLERI